MIQYPDSVWASTAMPMTASPVLVGDHESDVTIVGAGFTGLRCALVLLEAGLTVTVVDSQDVGWGASGRNGGKLIHCRLLTALKIYANY